MNFRNLTDQQSQVFEQIAIGNDTRHNYATIKSLLRKGFIERVGQMERTKSGLVIEINRYQVPLPIHIEWCAWCSQQEVTK